jgi:acyl-CoA synthetase (AMP-forming)/AMP-acid ligase II
LFKLSVSPWLLPLLFLLLLLLIFMVVVCFFGCFYLGNSPSSIYRLYTKESLVKTERRIAEVKAAKEAHDHHENEEEKEEKEEREKPRANAQLEQGSHLPPKFPEFPPELFGKPVEDVDDFYHDQYVSMALFM